MRRKPGTRSSTCCWPRPGGRSAKPVTASTRSPGCLTTRESASSITCCGARTECRWPSWRPRGREVRRRWASSRQAVRGLPPGTVRATPRRLLHQRVRALAVGRRRWLPAARGGALLPSESRQGDRFRLRSAATRGAARDGNGRGQYPPRSRSHSLLLGFDRATSRIS